jgi:hypothetical protein
VWRKHVEQGDMEDYIEYFSQEGHKPVMLVDGELEAQEDKLYLERFADIVTNPKKFVRLKRSDHYCNTAQSLGLVFYDKGVMNQLVHEIVQWLEQLHPQTEMTEGLLKGSLLETGLVL